MTFINQATAIKYTHKIHTMITDYLLAWPSQSPELNPVENLRAELKIKVHKRGQRTPEDVGILY